MYLQQRRVSTGGGGAHRVVSYARGAQSGGGEGATSPPDIDHAGAAEQYADITQLIQVPLQPCIRPQRHKGCTAQAAAEARQEGAHRRGAVFAFFAACG